MFSKANKTILAALVLIFASSVATAQEAKDNNAPVGPGQSPDAVFGPDAFGYIGYDSEEGQCLLDFIDISATGALVGDGDDVGFPVNLPGSGFEFYGTNFTTVAMSSNGYISTDPTDTGPDLSNDCPLPVTPSTGGGARLYPLHDDLDAEAGIGTLLFEYFADCPRASQAFGFAGEGCYVFQWNDISHFPGGGGAATFTIQAVLYEDSGAIVYQHGAGNPEAGSGSTTGIQNLAATDGLTYACNSAASIADNTAQCIYHPDAPPQPPFLEGLAGFQVDKIFDDGNTGEVEVTLSCNTGLPLQQSDTISASDNVTFVVGDFVDGDLNCVVTEGDAAGYIASYDNFTTISDTSCSFDGVFSNFRYNCEITNSLQPVDVVVTKWWMDENPQQNINYAEASYSCNNELFEDTFGTLEFLGDGSVASFSVFPRWDGITTCTVTETVVDNGVEFDDSECSSLSVTPGNGASCNIYNTRLYEGIPTLSQYGLAIMALLMLGVGFVAFRRIA